MLSKALPRQCYLRQNKSISEAAKNAINGDSIEWLFYWMLTILIPCTTVVVGIFFGWGSEILALPYLRLVLLSKIDIPLHQSFILLRTTSLLTWVPGTLLS